MKGEEKVILEKLKTSEILNIVKTLDENRDTLILLKDVDYHAQLHLKINKDAYDLIKVVFICGGVVSRADLIDIIYKGDKNIYSVIRKLIDYKLLKVDSKRDSNLFLTSNALSIMKGVKVRNGIELSKASETQLAKAKLILSLIERDSDMIYTERDAIELRIDHLDLKSVNKALSDEYMTSFKNDVSDYYSKVLSLNCYFSVSRTMLAMYAKDENDLKRKFKKLLKIDSTWMMNVDIRKIVILTLDDLDFDKTRSTLINLHQEHLNEERDPGRTAWKLSSNISSLKLEILN